MVGALVPAASVFATSTAMPSAFCLPSAAGLCGATLLPVAPKDGSAADGPAAFDAMPGLIGAAFSLPRAEVDVLAVAFDATGATGLATATGAADSGSA